ncbi:MAG: NUDIX domain-containing protein, partial [Chloroflexi bacterium]|nr:NUDIX domain-containing protein [Chloroflexota bacterium]
MGARQQGADATQHRWLTMPRTLSFVINGDDVLMLKRDAGKRVFPNQYNGLGGHVERDEDVRSSALREIEEESGLSVHSLRLRSIHNIDAGEASGILLFVFTA